MVTDTKIKELQLIYKMRLRLAVERAKKQDENYLINLEAGKIYKGIVKDLKILRGSLLK